MVIGHHHGYCSQVIICRTKPKWIIDHHSSEFVMISCTWFILTSFFQGRLRLEDVLDFWRLISIRHVRTGRIRLPSLPYKHSSCIISVIRRLRSSTKTSPLQYRKDKYWLNHRLYSCMDDDSKQIPYNHDLTKWMLPRTFTSSYVIRTPISWADVGTVLEAGMKAGWDWIVASEIVEVRGWY